MIKYYISLGDQAKYKIFFNWHHSRKCCSVLILLIYTCYGAPAVLLAPSQIVHLICSVLM